MFVIEIEKHSELRILRFYGPACFEKERKSVRGKVAKSSELISTIQTSSLIIIVSLQVMKKCV